MASSSSSSLVGESGRITRQPLSLPSSSTLQHHHHQPVVSYEEVYRLHARIGELTMENEALRRQLLLLLEGDGHGASGEVPPSHLSGGPSSTVADQARLLLSLAESVKSGVPPLVTTGELGEAIAVLWTTIKGRIRLAQEYRAAGAPVTALSPLPEATRLRSTGEPLKPVKEEEEGEGGEEEVECPTVRTDDLSEDIVRLKDIREGLGNILDGGNREKGRARVSAKPSGPVQASPVSKNRLHPRQTWNYPPPATPASSARKRLSRLPSPSPIRGYPAHAQDSEISFRMDHSSCVSSSPWSQRKGESSSLFDISESTHYIFRDNIPSTTGSINVVNSLSKQCREPLRQDALGTITALESALGKRYSDENAAPNEEVGASEYMMTRRRFSM